MKKRLLVVIGLTLMTMSCSKDEPLDLEGIAWLQERIAEIERSSIAQFSYIDVAEYKRDRVFIFDNCCPFCASLPPQVYDESGESLGFLGTDIEEDKVKNQTLFWEPEDAACVR